MKVIGRGNRQYVVLSESKLQEVTIFDMNGRQMNVFMANYPDHIDLNLMNQPPGIYLLKIKTENFETTKKMVVKD